MFISSFKSSFCKLLYLPIFQDRDIILIFQDPHLVDSLSNKWTDEKHTLFLNSIEETFVNELYNGEYHSKPFVGWLSRIKKHKGFCEPYENDSKFGQVFKALRRSCQESLRFDGDNNPADIESGFLPFYANPWIQHFRSPSIMKKRLIRSSYRVDNIEFIRPSVQLANVRHDGEATSSKRICREDSVGSNAEVSDQNFIADELVAGKKSIRIHRKRRLAKAVVHEPITDQVVPSGEPLLVPTFIKKHACLQAMDARSSGRSPEVSSCFLPMETEASLCGNQLVNS
ncbi:hypothetical protein BHE74_00000457 [Ensete ventricosum]|uniref:Uncharacterized protein n=1 Tax=Ensete ventricosum TaxID=4639 RepID=A0A426Y710_ENSVE|nr:hypothetical protein B296_00050602 [Ensete ventricosum]RWW90433.1 hypothetical protein BHE74_00000457 [Ensete ventricosum]RZR92309.1 hypothetical protein BHM03_00020586 [Ensete ventricosum]